MALYVRLLVRTAAQKGWEIHLLTTAKALRHPAFKLVHSEYKDLAIHLMPNVNLSQSTGFIGLLLNQFRYYVAIFSGFRDINPREAPDVIYMVNIDHIDKVMALLGTPFGVFKFTGMMMNIKFHRRKMKIGSSSRNDWLYEKLLLQVLKIKTLSHLVVIDEPFFHFACKASKSVYKKLILVPDVGELHGKDSAFEARSFLNIHNNAFVILIYGALSPKKGIEQLLRAVLAGNLPDVVVLLAGVQDDRIRDLLSKPWVIHLVEADQLLIFPQFHNEDQEYRVFRASNAVWLGYIGNSFGSSGVLYQACSLGLPVLATSNGLIGWIVNHHNIGVTFDPTDVEKVAQSINLLFNDRNLITVFSANAEKLAIWHSATKFGDSICDAIQQK